MSRTVVMMEDMGRSSKVIMSVVLVGLGLAGCVYFLLGQGLDKAEKWASVVGVFVSVAIGVAGLVLSWATWRQARPALAHPPAGSLGEAAGQDTAPAAGQRHAGNLAMTATATDQAKVYQVGQGDLTINIPAGSGGGQPDSSASPGGGSVTTRIADGEFTGPVLMVRDMRQGNLAGTGSPNPPGDSASEPAATPPSGDVSHTIDGGRFHGLVVMGRDLTGTTLPSSAGSGTNPDGADR